MRVNTSRTARWAWAAVAPLAAGLLAAILVTVPAIACSPPSPAPTVATLPDDAVVVLGTTGDRVEGGRLFYVERVFSGEIGESPIVIAFQEGEPIGDCSYPMSSGARLIIAPDQWPDGVLHADIVTLQADPGSEDGRRFLAEAQARYGEGTVPPGRNTPPPLGEGVDRRVPLLVGLAGAVGLLGALVWRRRRRPDGAPRQS
ncbi:MAG TPA: hypothetical protein VFY23_06780 [Candidatus Limnocylindrales bacterium]|nr:hypothetical protein [Candidatus Limnocylindrales bacterium]